MIFGSLEVCAIVYTGTGSLNLQCACMHNQLHSMIRIPDMFKIISSFSPDSKTDILAACSKFKTFAMHLANFL